MYIRQEYSLSFEDNIKFQPETEISGLLKLTENSSFDLNL
jgi:hypothetical protein